jgi:hypothetical protein
LRTHTCPITTSASQNICKDQAKQKPWDNTSNLLHVESYDNKKYHLFSHIRIQDGDWDTARDRMSSMNDFAEMLETCLAEVKHEEELKHQHSEP